jgi:hypothetical protein
VAVGDQSVIMRVDIGLRGTAMMARVRLFGWWYICIGLAFAALAARAFVAGAPGWGVGLRVMVAAGFVLLGIGELRRRGNSGRG